MVRVLDDANEVRRLQKGHGGWVDEMAKVSFLLENKYNFPGHCYTAEQN